MKPKLKRPTLLAAAHGSEVPTPRTDKETWTTIAGAFKCSGANGDLEGQGEYVPTPFARRLERENAILCDFINREMKMTASDPRIGELEKRIAGLPNAGLEPTRFPRGSEPLLGKDGGRQ